METRTEQMLNKVIGLLICERVLMYVFIVCVVRKPLTYIEAVIAVFTWFVLLWVSVFKEIAKTELDNVHGKEDRENSH